MVVRAGSTYWDRGGFLAAIDQVIQHHSYQFARNEHDYDFALLKLKGPLQFTSSIKPVSLPEQNENFNSGLNTIISGWGARKENDKQKPRELHAANIRTLDYQTCTNTYGQKFTPRMFCAGFIAGGIDTCQGTVEMKIKTFSCFSN